MRYGRPGLYLFLILLLVSGCGLFKSGPVDQRKTASKKSWISLETRMPDQTLIHALANEPFRLDTSPLQQVQQIRGIQRIDTTLQENIHVAGQIDTVFTFYLPGSKLGVYKALDRSFLFHAQLMENILPINRDLRIGMKRSEFRAILPEATPDFQHIRLESEYVEQYIDFYFQNDTLSQVEYQGYLD